MGAGELESVDYRRAARSGRVEPSSELIKKEEHGMPCPYGTKEKHAAADGRASKTAGLKTSHYRRTKSDEPGSPE
jgi:hypothetical protein